MEKREQKRKINLYWKTQKKIKRKKKKEKEKKYKKNIYIKKKVKIWKKVIKKSCKSLNKAENYYGVDGPP